MMTSWHVDFKKYLKNHVPTICPLPGERGQICGLMGTHVDDLLWCGNDEMDAG